MAKHPVVLVHGYSDKGESFKGWRTLLAAAGHDARTIHVGNYVSLSNEVSLKDIAEGFDRALKEAGLDDTAPFDAIVHSTGMLVVREWLAGTSGAAGSPRVAAERQGRLKRLVGLAPATFGSPMAHKGRSWLGAMFKGGRQLGPDFMEAGDQVLAALELGSQYTWDLAHRDFLAESAVYGKSASTPFPFLFVGLEDYGWLRRAVTEPGTDGTVRWSGVGFNSRKITIDLTVEPSRRKRVQIEPWKNTAVPLVFLSGLNHASILTEPSRELQQMVLAALAVSSGPDYERWCKRHQAANAATLKAARATRWQQFVIHAVDERGDGIKDYFVEIGTVGPRGFSALAAFDLDVHAYKNDRSFRCFHVNLDKLPKNLGGMAMRVIAESGTELVAYHGFDSSHGALARPREAGKWDAVLEFDEDLGRDDIRFFFPYTTTLMEVKLNREPMPLGGVNRVFWFKQD